MNEQAPAETPIAQTGTGSTPIQVENVQYNVPVPHYTSKPGLVFGIAKISLAAFLLAVASSLYEITGLLLGFAGEHVAGNIQLMVSLSVPAGVIAFVSVRRMKTIIADSPALLEDITFKARLRRAFIFFLSLSALFVFVTIFNTIGIFVGTASHPVTNSFFSLYYGGGLIIMTLWLYSYQVKTRR